MRSNPRLQQTAGRLVDVAALGGFFHRVYRSNELPQSAPIVADGRMRLAVPGLERRATRLIGLENGRLVDVGRCALAARLSEALQVVSPGELRVIQPEGRALVIRRDCTP